VSLAEIRLPLPSSSSSPLVSLPSSPSPPPSSSLLPLDSVASKLALMSTCLQLTINFLRVEGIVHVKSARHRSSLQGGRGAADRQRIRARLNDAEADEVDEDERANSDSEADSAGEEE
jgi:hypothetical protein